MIDEKKISYPNIGQSWWATGIIVLLLIGFSPVIVIFENVIGKELLFLVYYLLAMGSAFWIVHFIRNKKTGINNYDFSLSSLKLMILVSVGVIAIQIGIITPITTSIPVPEFWQKIFLESFHQNGVFSFIAIVIAAPILEELIFRGIILNGLLRRYSPIKSIILSSLLFGIVHLNPWQFITAFTIGLFSGWVYYRTRKLLLPIIIHFVNNFIAFVGVYFMDAEMVFNESLIEIYGGLIKMILITVSAIIVSFLCVLLLRKHFKMLKIEKWQHE